MGRGWTPAYAGVGVEAASCLVTGVTAVRHADLQCEGRPSGGAWVERALRPEGCQQFTAARQGAHWAPGGEGMVPSSRIGSCYLLTAVCCSVDEGGRDHPFHQLTGFQPSFWKHLNTHAELYLTLRRAWRACMC